MTRSSKRKRGSSVEEIGRTRKGSEEELSQTLPSLSTIDTQTFLTKAFEAQKRAAVKTESAFVRMFEAKANAERARLDLLINERLASVEQQHSARVAAMEKLLACVIPVVGSTSNPSGTAVEIANTNAGNRPVYMEETRALVHKLIDMAGKLTQTYERASKVIQDQAAQLHIDCRWEQDIRHTQSLLKIGMKISRGRVCELLGADDDDVEAQKLDCDKKPGSKSDNDADPAAEDVDEEAWTEPARKHMRDLTANDDREDEWNDEQDTDAMLGEAIGVPKRDGRSWVDVAERLQKYSRKLLKE